MKTKKVHFNSGVFTALFSSINAKQNEIKQKIQEIAMENRSLAARIVKAQEDEMIQQFLGYSRKGNYTLMAQLLDQFHEWSFKVFISELEINKDNGETKAPNNPTQVLLLEDSVEALSIPVDHGKKLGEFFNQVNESLPDEIELHWHTTVKRLTLWLMPR